MKFSGLRKKVESLLDKHRYDIADIRDEYDREEYVSHLIIDGFVGRMSDREVTKVVDANRGMMGSVFDRLSISDPAHRNRVALFRFIEEYIADEWIDRYID